MATFSFSNPFRMSHKTILSSDFKVLRDVLSKQHGKHSHAWKRHGYEFVLVEVYMAGHITFACIDIILSYDLPVYVLFISANAVNVFSSITRVSITC